MIKNTIYSLLLCMSMLLAGSACTDDILFEDGYIGEGESNISVTMRFHPLVSTETNSGRASAGDALSDLQDISVFVYDAQGKIYNIYSGEDLADYKLYKKDETGSNTSMPSDGGVQAEESTAKATFTLKGIPFGRYYFYAVANMGEAFTNDEATRKKFERIKDLQDYKVKWDEEDITANGQMFGYFTTTDAQESEGFDAPLLTISQARCNLHSWIQRCASKITVVFDGSGLFDNIWIYVKNVRVKDIPRYCNIGADNGVYTLEADSMIAEGDCINYGASGPLPGDTQPDIDYKKWLEISRGSGLKGAVDIADGDTVTHSEKSPALYFYENLQGNYPGDKKYDKRPDWNDVGHMPTPDEVGYKDNVKYGTYIEVEAYYNSTNANNVSQGRIIYRFMLGQDDTYDYNARRNHHYKVTLGFKGYANQPDWHIAYIEPPRTIFTDPTYYISYQYNQKAIFPIRIIGDITQVEAEIVENNWAPFDSTKVANVPPAEIGSGVMDFKWNKPVYDNTGKQDKTDVLKYPSNAASTTAYDNFVNNYGYYYGLQRPYSTDGKSRLASGYGADLEAKGAPKYVTPIWAGFLALNVPDGTLDPVLLPNDMYSYGSACLNLKNYYYNNNQNYRKLTSEDLKKDVVDAGTNNECKITHAADGSITVHFPMWTRPKSILGISGFSGNNPYDTYQRRAIVKLTFTYADGKKIIRYKPVYQVRRVVNPKAVWRKNDDTTPFHVVLARREGADASKFSGFESEGAWRAYVKAGDRSFITLSGGQSGGSGEIYGDTGKPVEFDIFFNGEIKANESKCAIIEIEYHGFTCRHSIFVRQGYNTPLDIVGDGKKWSSYALYKCSGTNAAFGTQWNATSQNYIDAELTASPLSLGTFFKRGNYNGIMISNNLDYGVSVSPGVNSTFLMGDGSRKTWKEIEGYPYANQYGGWSLKPYEPSTLIQNTFEWGRFKATVGGEERHYRLPTYNEYVNLQLHCDYGIGVMYGDGATTTALDVDDAYGFEDTDNNGSDNNVNKPGITRGMRGVIVFNTNNGNQLFFPVGARGVGRRTISGYTATSYNQFGMLRYSSVLAPLDGNQNSFRPIPYNMPASPGALYWFQKPSGGNMCWDCNYFDMNFTTYSFPVGFTPNYSEGTNFNKTHGGDALPIKLILVE